MVCNRVVLNAIFRGHFVAISVGEEAERRQGVFEPGPSFEDVEATQRKFGRSRGFSVSSQSLRSAMSVVQRQRQERNERYRNSLRSATSFLHLNVVHTRGRNGTCGRTHCSVRLTLACPETDVQVDPSDNLFTVKLVHIDEWSLHRS